MNERQLIHSQLLTFMLADNNRPEEQLPLKHPAGKLLLRLLVAIVLGIAFFFQFFGNAPINLNVVQSEIPAVQEFFKKLYTLPEDVPLLIAADFDPAFYGEMKLVSSPVIRHLALRSSKLVFVSTNPAGPLLGENLLRDALADLDRTKSGWGNYNTQQLTENLGYLPGGQSSLRELSFDIRKATHFGLLTLRDRRWPWNNPALSGINTLADFGAVILLVDNLDKGRAWVEQVQPSLGQTPLLVISSAQARPMLEPYFLSGQLSGLISGVEDSSAYEQISGLPVAHAAELGLYRISVMFITGFILLGSVVVFLSLLPGWLRKLKGGRR